MYTGGALFQRLSNLDLLCMLLNMQLLPLSMSFKDCSGLVTILCTLTLTEVVRLHARNYCIFRLCLGY